MKHSLLLVVLIFSLSGCKEALQPYVEHIKASEVAQSVDQLSVEEMVEGIRQALQQGVQQAVGFLGARDGFRLSNLYHIDIPAELQDWASLLRKIGQGERVDEFEARLNLAAEDAVKAALPVFVDTIQQMSVEDALNILQGPDNAATDYFRTSAGESLNQKFRPIIAAATNETGLTQTYKGLSEKLLRISPKLANYTIDLDQYILDRANLALYERVAAEEKAIRDQPLKRSTDLLKKVFGQFGNEFQAS